MFVIDQAASTLAPVFCGGRAQSSVEIWFAQASGDGLVVSGEDAAGAVTHVFAPDWSGLLIADRVKLQIVGGHAKWHAGDMAAFAKLQAFADAGRIAAASDDNFPPALTALAVAHSPDAADRRAGEYWFLTQSLNPGAEFSRLCAVLRRTECYQLVRFLLAQPATLKMRELSVRYGLSYSHFRSMCRHALGRGGKAEIQQWRNVRALLDMVDGGGSLTDVALRQGFASSAHFSDAMKNQFGIAPSNLVRVSQTGQG